jgi:hypothetical protein
MPQLRTKRALEHFRISKSDASFFFERPTTIPARHTLNGGRQSVLYLLRREALDSLIGELLQERRWGEATITIEYLDKRLTLVWRHGGR